MLRLRQLRKQQKITMRDFGHLFGLAESTISLYETGKRQIDNETLIKFANYFNVTTDYLLGNDINNEQKSKPVPNETSLSPDEYKLVMEYRKMNSEGKKFILKSVVAQNDK